jgi:hypothetical protein
MATMLKFYTAVKYYPSRSVYLHIQLKNLHNGGTSDPPVSQVRAAAMLLIASEGNS